MTGSAGKLHSFAPNAQIVHIDIDTAAISKNVQVDVPIVADAKEAVTKMLEYVTPCETGKWLDTIEELESGASAEDEKETDHDTAGCY